MNVLFLSTSDDVDNKSTGITKQYYNMCECTVLSTSDDVDNKSTGITKNIITCECTVFIYK